MQKNKNKIYVGNFNLPIFNFFLNEIEIMIVIWYNIWNCALILLKYTIKHVFIELIFKISIGMLYYAIIWITYTLSI